MKSQACLTHMDESTRNLGVLNRVHWWCFRFQRKYIHRILLYEWCVYVFSILMLLIWWGRDNALWKCALIQKSLWQMNFPSLCFYYFSVQNQQLKYRIYRRNFKSISVVFSILNRTKINVLENWVESIRCGMTNILSNGNVHCVIQTNVVSMYYNQQLAEYAQY